MDLTRCLCCFVLWRSYRQAWESENDVVNINMEPYDRDNIVHMIKGENAQFNKVTTVFSVLCAEMRSLRVLAEEKFYAPLTMYGHAVDENAGSSGKDEKDNKSGGSAGSTPAAPTAGTIKNVGPEAAMGSFLPFLQDLNNFVTRCNNISRYVTTLTMPQPTRIPAYPHTRISAYPLTASLRSRELY